MSNLPNVVVSNLLLMPLPPPLLRPTNARTCMCPLTYAPLNNYLEGASFVLRELCELVHHEVVHMDRSLEGRNHVERCGE